MTKREALNGKPYAGNPNVRFDEGEAASTCTAAIETEGRNSPSIAQGLPLLRREPCRRQPEGRASGCSRVTAIRLRSVPSPCMCGAAVRRKSVYVRFLPVRSPFAVRVLSVGRAWGIGWGGEVIREWACRSEYWFEWVNNRQTLPRECVKLHRNNLVKLSCLGVDFLPRIVI